MTNTPTQRANLRGALSDDRRALLGRCVSEGWSYRQIQLTHRIAPKTVRNYYPDYKGMSQVEGAKLGALYLHAFHNVNHV